MTALALPASVVGMETTTAITVPDGTIPADIDLIGLDGNAFSVIGAMVKGLRRAGNGPEVEKSFTEQAMAGDYDYLLRVAMAFNGDI